MNKKNIVLVFTVVIILLLNWSFDLLRENRAYKDRTQGNNRQAVVETIDHLKPFYQMNVSSWEQRLKEVSGPLLLDVYISDLRQSSQFYRGLFKSDISLLAGTLDEVIFLLEELKENGKLTDMQSEDLKEAILQARTIAGQLITYAEASENGWYTEFTDEESQSAKYVRGQLKSAK
ncbi:putative enzyme related to lactoylglutathione lyase [Sporosarcina luteola]|nr:putative enzyme related to lactoylglutathione lyase [Sporosarcina luteola]